MGRLKSKSSGEPWGGGGVAGVQHSAISQREVQLGCIGVWVGTRGQAESQSEDSCCIQVGDGET